MHSLREYREAISNSCAATSLRCMPFTECLQLSALNHRAMAGHDCALAIWCASVISVNPELLTVGGL